jgi:GAF domain-containing protein
MIGVPLFVGGELIGVLLVGTIEPRKFTQEDVHLLQLVADRAASAIERTRLLEEERDARSRAEELARNINLLLESTDEGIYTINREGRCTLVNRSAARMLGYTP